MFLNKENPIPQTGCFYKQLRRDELQGASEVYCTLYSAIRQHQKTICIAWKKTDEAADKKVLNRFLFFVLADHPEMFYVNWEKTSYYFNGTVAEIKPKYVFSKEECRRLQKEIEKRVLYLTLVAKCFCGKNEKQLIKYLYCYFVEHMSYAGNKLKSKDEKEQCRIHSAVGALLDEKAVCDGIARGFKLLLDELGIENWTIRRNIRENMEFSHEWNVIMLNGKALHVDITWEMDVHSVRKQVLYEFFLLTEKEMQEKHQKGSALECFRQKTK